VVQDGELDEEPAKADSAGEIVAGQVVDSNDRSESATGRLDVLDLDARGLLARELEQGIALCEHAHLGLDVHPVKVRVAKEKRELLLERVDEEVPAGERMPAIVVSHREREVLGRSGVVVAEEAVVLDVRDLERQPRRSGRRPLASNRRMAK